MGHFAKLAKEIWPNITCLDINYILDLELQFMPSMAWFRATYFRFGDLWSACGIWYQSYNMKAFDFAAAAYAIS